MHVIIVSHAMAFNSHEQLLRAYYHDILFRHGHGVR